MAYRPGMKLPKSAEELDGRGAGIVTHPPLLEAMVRAGVPAGMTR